MSLGPKYSVHKVLLLGLALSLFLHILPVPFLDHLAINKPSVPVRVKMQITKIPEAPPEAIPEPKLPEPKPPKPKKPKPEAGLAKPNLDQQSVPPASVSGLSADSVVEKGQGAFKANLGNTLSEAPPEVRPSSVPSGSADKSRDAILISASAAKVEYTDEALDAGFEGRVIADVFVETDGTVSSAELRKKVGYGMDARLLTAARAAKFKPRLNSQGIPERAWAEITFSLVIP